MAEIPSLPWVGRAALGGGARVPDRARTWAGSSEDAWPDEERWSAEPVPMPQLGESAPRLPAEPPMPDPPESWQENWYGHTQLLRRHHLDDHAAVYVDRDVDRSGLRHLTRHVSELWHYCKQTYGDDFGADPRVYAIFHQGRHYGGHAVGRTDPVKGYRNVIDVGDGSWHPRPGLYEVTTHEISHLVEGESNGVSGSPAYPLWGDSKWAEFFIHDVYAALGVRDAVPFSNRVLQGSDDFPRPGTAWFRDWFHPMWIDAHGPSTMVAFFRLLATHFPRDQSGIRYARDLNWGEYLHFTSAAAGGDLRRRAVRAFGVPQQYSTAPALPDAWIAQWDRARDEFPGLRY